MYKHFLKVAVIIFFLGFAQTAQAQSPTPITSPVAAMSESVTNFASDITINQDASINVAETIDYDFGSTEHHGIFRDITYKYNAHGGTFKLRFSNLSVSNETGASVPFTKSYTGNYLHLQIGDPDTTITGAHVYKISYTVQRAMNYFADHDELYWNVTGLGWKVPIAKASTILHAPATVSQVTCYTGPLNSKDQNCTITGGNTKLVTFTTTKPVGDGDGITIVAGMPLGSVAKPTTVQKLWDIFLDNGILILPILVFLLMLYLWNRFGKDARSKNSVVAQYEAPDKLSPLYMGTLVHGKTENKDIAAELVYLATRGFLKIKRLETTKLLLFKGTDYEFTKIDKDSGSLAPQTKALLDAIFSGGADTANLSDLKSDVDFGKSLLQIKSSTNSEIVKQGYYHYNPTLMVGLWWVIGLAVGIGGGFLLVNLIGMLGATAAIISGVIIIGFSFIMPARTQKGADAVAAIKGLELYLDVAEKDRINFHNAPEKNPQHFEQLLPFAIALGVEAAWAAQFKDLTNAPSWYNDNNGGAFNALMFTNSMSNFSSSVQSVASSSVSSASSGGSGFSGGGSGGGFGGGGGGSW